jgi:hypothetical protein
LVDDNANDLHSLGIASCWKELEYGSAVLGTENTMIRGPAKPDHDFQNVGEHTQKTLPRISWRRLANTGASGKMMIALFFGTLLLLALLIVIFGHPFSGWPQGHHK